MKIYSCSRNGVVISREALSLDAVARAYGWRETETEAIELQRTILVRERQFSAQALSACLSNIREFTKNRGFV